MPSVVVMKSVLFALIILPSPLLASPTSDISIARTTGPKLEGSYIVKVKDSVDKKLTVAWLRAYLHPEDNITHDYDESFFNAFAGTFSESTLNQLTMSKDVEYIAEDAILRINAVQTGAPWGLQRVGKRGPLPQGSNPNTLTYSYTLPARSGAGVDVYVLDTGINIAHEDFQPGRARFGYSTVTGTEDGNGHGTHCAGTVGGNRFGVAKQASLIAVKVLKDDGSGSTSGIIAGIDWTVAQYKRSSRPSIISMSLGGTANTALDMACTSAVRAGVNVVVAAGNNNADASNFSPARAEGVITVGATTIQDQRASFSNYGTTVDIYGPGQNVISTWIGSNTAVNNISGTSMATPHVAGVMAVYLNQYGPKFTPDALTSLIKRGSDKTSSGLLVVQNPPLV